MALRWVIAHNVIVGLVLGLVLKFWWCGLPQVRYLRLESGKHLFLVLQLPFQIIVIGQEHTRRNIEIIICFLDTVDILH